MSTNYIRIHVFADLQPYICTFERCRSMLVTFADRKAWSEHEAMHHRLCCSLGCHLCSTTCSTQHDLTEHLHQNHDLPSDQCQLLAALSFAGSNDVVSAERKECPLCLQKEWSSQRQFVIHLGRHLEEIALSVLPREVDSESDEHSDGDEPLEDAKVSLRWFELDRSSSISSESSEVDTPTEDFSCNRTGRLEADTGGVLRKVVRQDVPARDPSGGTLFAHTEGQSRNPPVCKEVREER